MERPSATAGTTPVDETIDYRRPTTRDGERAVIVERRDGGSVAIGIHYPRRERVEAYIGLAISAALALALPVAGFVAGSWVGAGAAALVAIPVCLLIFDSYRSVVSAQEWVASPEGLTIVRHVPWGGPHRRFIPRSRISDVQMKYSRNRRSGCDIRVRGRYFAPFSAGPTLYGLPADQIEQAADAVREGLGLPPVESAGHC
jgi:hypothetical protein